MNFYGYDISAEREDTPSVYHYTKIIYYSVRPTKTATNNSTANGHSTTLSAHKNPNKHFQGLTEGLRAVKLKNIIIH